MVDDNPFSITVTTDGVPRNGIPLSWGYAILCCGVGIVLVVLAMLLLRGLGQLLLRDMRRKTQELD